MSSTIRYGIALLLFALAFLNPAKLWKRNQAIDLPGLNVLVITDKSSGNSINTNVMLSTQVRQWLTNNANAVYIWDDSHTEFEYIDPAWKTAYVKTLEHSKGNLPWVLISGDGSTSQPLPSDPQSFIKLLEDYK